MAVRVKEQEEKSGSDTRLLISVPEAAELLSIGTTFAWELVHQGTIPSVKLGRRVLIPRHSLERLIRVQQFAASGDE